MQINPNTKVLSYVCKSSTKDAFLVAFELIKRGIDINIGCPLHVAIKHK
jgi:tRNA-dihydrouridine synthase